MKYKLAEIGKSNTGRFQKKALFAAVVTAPFFMSPASSCFAEEDNIGLEEVVVTATRREESLQSVPLSVTAMSGNQLQAQGITEFKDLKRVAAGLHMESYEGVVSGSIRVRGVGSRSNSSVDPSVGVIVDGLYQPRIGTVFTEMQDIDRVEVLRGPQGTMFGKNTTAGVVLVHTKKPDTHEFSGKVQTVLGSYNNYEYRGVVNVPLIEDTLALRFNGFSAKNDNGYINNNLTGHDAEDYSRQGGRLKLLFTPTENLEVLYGYEYTDTDAVIVKQAANYGTLDRVPNPPAPANPLVGSSLEDVGIALGKPLPDIRKYSRDVWQADSWASDNIKRHTLRVSWDVAGHTLTSTTGYDELDSTMYQDRDGTLLDLGTLENYSPSRYKTQEFQIASNGDGPLEYVLGMWYQEDDTVSNTTVIEGADWATLKGSAATTTDVISMLSAETLAGFANATYHLDDQWSVTLGTRYTDNKKTQQQDFDLGFATVRVIDGETSFLEWTYSGKVAYDINDDQMVYFSYDKGFKSGGFNRQNVACVFGVLSQCIAPEDLTYDAEWTDSYEIGWKTEWLDNRIRLNGAVFFQTYDDYQVTSSVPPASIQIRNAAKVESRGVELELAAAVTEALTIDANFAFIRAVYDEFEDAPCSKLVSKSISCIQDLSDKQIDNAPERTLNLGATYEGTLESFDGLGWFVRGDASYRSEVNFNDALDEDTKMGGYTIFSARAGISAPDEQWTVTLWAMNLADKDYAIHAERTEAGATDGLNWKAGPPFTYGVTLDLNF